MKKYLLIIVFSFYNIYGQNTFESYKNFPIDKSSCQILNSVVLDIKNSSYKDELENFLRKRQNDFLLKSEYNIQDMINDFNLTLDKTKKQYEAQEFLWKSEGELKKYGLNVLSKLFEVLPSKYLINFLSPAIQQGIEVYIDNDINEKIESHKDEIDKLIQERINLLYSNGIDVTKETDNKSFENYFAMAHADIPALKRDQYGIFNKELIKRAFDYIDKNRSEISLINLKMNNSYEKTNKEVQSKFKTLQGKITQDVKDEFSDIGKSISFLTKNQEAVFQSLNNIQQRVIKNEARIQGLEKEMSSVKYDISNLKIKQDEHSTLLAQNSFQIEILSGYIFNNLNTDQKLEILESKDAEKIFHFTNKAELISDLKTIKTKETIIGVSQSIDKYAHLGFNVLEQSGVLKGKDAVKVAKFVYGVSIASGIARVCAGDYSGITSVFSGIAGLISKPQKSPELQMMDKMYETMENHFARIDTALYIINIKIDTLFSVLNKMYSSLMLSYQCLGDQIDRINWRTTEMKKLMTAIIYSDYQACETLKETWESNKISFITYSDYKKYFNPDCQKCLEGLSDFTIGKNLSYFWVSSNPMLKSENFIEEEVTKIYNPTKELFRSFYKDELNSTFYALMFPVKFTNETNEPLYFITHNDDLRQLNYDDVIEEYYSYEMINEFSSILLEFAAYFEIAGNHSTYDPPSLKEYLSRYKENGVNVGLLEFRLKKLLDIIQFSFIQQSIISGNLLLEPIYSTLFNFSTNQNEIKLSFEALNNNKLLATNFATYLFHKNIDLHDTSRIKRLYENSKVDSRSLDTLNSLIRLNDITFYVDSVNKYICIKFNRNGKDLNLLCPDFNTLINNNMLYSEGIFTLLDSRQKINSRLIDLKFTSNLNKESNMEENFKCLFDPLSKESSNIFPSKITPQKSLK